MDVGAGPTFLYTQCYCIYSGVHICMYLFCFLPLSPPPQR